MIDEDDLTSSSELFNVETNTRVLNFIIKDAEKLKSQIKLRPATAVPYNNNNQKKINTNAKINFVTKDDDDDDDDDDEVLEEVLKTPLRSPRINTAERKRNYLDFISQSILSKNAFSFVKNEKKNNSRPMSCARPTSRFSRISFNSNKTSLKNSRSNSGFIRSESRKSNKSLRYDAASELDDIESYVNMNYSSYTFASNNYVSRFLNKNKKAESSIDSLEESRKKFFNELSDTSMIRQEQNNSMMALEKENDIMQNSMESFTASFNENVKKKTSEHIENLHAHRPHIYAHSAKPKLQTTSKSIQKIKINQMYKLNVSEVIIFLRMFFFFFY